MQSDETQTIRIQNDSASVLVRGYAYTGDGLLVWLEMAPQHPKLIGAIWASLVGRSYAIPKSHYDSAANYVNGHKTYLQLKDSEKGLGKGFRCSRETVSNGRLPSLPGRMSSVLYCP